MEFWSSNYIFSFEDCHDYHTCALIPRFFYTFQVDTDASVMVIGAVLSQNYHPLPFSLRRCPKNAVLIHLSAWDVCHHWNGKEMVQVLVGVHISHLYWSTEHVKHVTLNYLDTKTTKNRSLNCWDLTMKYIINLGWLIRWSVCFPANLKLLIWFCWQFLPRFWPLWNTFDPEGQVLNGRMTSTCGPNLSYKAT